MSLNPGAYREVIEIRKKDGWESDSVGNQIPKLVTFLKCRAYVNNLAGNEYWAAAQVKAENTVVFSLRGCRKVQSMNTREYDILWNGNEYNIVSIDDVQHKGELIKIRATARV